MDRVYRFLFLLSASIIIAHTSQLRADDQVIEQAPVIVIDNARFTAISPKLIRLEYAAYSRFEDRPSLAFTNRTPTGEFKHTLNEMGWHILDTGELRLIYRGNNETFQPRNLWIEQTVNGRKVTWRPGKRDTGNLKGTYRTLDGVSGATSLEPGILSREGWALVDDTPTPLFDSKDGRTWFAERNSDTAVDWYYFGFGRDYKGALAEFTRIAGKIPLPPKYTFGAWWSRYWAYSDAELRELVREFDENDVPLDVLVIDMDWHLDGWTGYTWNPKYFPDPEGFLKWVHEQGLKATLNLHPADGVGKHEKAFPEMCKAMGLDPEKTERIAFDCTDPKYMDAYFKYLHHPLEDMGIDFWWMDWQQGTDTRIKGLDPLFALNHLHWNDMLSRAEETHRRPLIFSRWGGLGNHRYQIGFSGDTFCNWPSLAFQPWFTATAGNVGYDYWSHDIGGHQPGQVDPEMYVRWIQWGALSPILRTHTTKNPLAERRIWKFEAPFFDAARKAYHLRYELMPYIYGMARKCYDTAVPLCRPLYYEWPNLNEAYENKNGYMFGDDLYVAPVVEPADPVSGCTMMETWLPPGRWVNWFTGQLLNGNRMVQLVVPLDEIPLFVRPGAIIPMSPYNTRSSGTDASVLSIFPGGEGSAALYEDDGISNDYTLDKCARTRVESRRNGIEQRVLIGPSEGGFNGMREQRAFEIRLNDVPPPKMVMVGKDQVEQSKEGDNAGWWYDTDAFCLHVRTGMQPRNEALGILVHYDATPTIDATLQSGMRGRIRRLHEISAELKDQTPSVVALALDAGASLMRPLPEEGRRPEVDAAANSTSLLEAIRSAVNDDRKFERMATRLLGIYRRLDIAPRYDDTQPFRASLTAALCGPFAPESKGALSVALDTPQGWSRRDDEGSESAGGGAGLSTAFIAIDPPSGELATTVLSGRVTLKLKGVEAPFEVWKTVFPSINGWWVIGPFHAKFTESPGLKFPPEDGVDLGATYDGKDGRKLGWRKVQRELKPGGSLADEFFIDFDDFVGTRVYESVAYAFTWIDAPEDCDAVLAFGSDDGAVLWLNGEEVYRVHVGRPYTSRQDHVKVHLRQGENTLLVKISQDGGDWGLGVHIETPDGKPMTQVRTRLTPLPAAPPSRR